MNVPIGPMFNSTLKTYIGQFTDIYMTQHAQEPIEPTAYYITHLDIDLQGLQPLH